MSAVRTVKLPAYQSLEVQCLEFFNLQLSAIVTPVGRGMYEVVLSRRDKPYARPSEAYPFLSSYNNKWCDGKGRMTGYETYCLLRRLQNSDS